MPSLPDADWLARPDLAQLIAALDPDGGECRYVGGAVRDTLVGLAVNDVDIATRLEPSQVLAQLDEAGIKAVPTGIEHGTITAILKGGPVEITTLRRDVTTDGRRATVAFSRDWKEDAERRDFTINALYADPNTREITDYFDGIADLEKSRVRFIGDAAKRIAEDRLRILRFFRFHARFGGTQPDAKALAAAAAHADELVELSAERIADELLKILALPDPVPTMTLMLDHDILRSILPEISDAERLARLIEREHRFPEQAPRPLRRLMALLPTDPNIARKVAARLKLSNAQKRRLAIAAGRIPGDTANARILAYRHGRDCAVDRLLLCATNDTVVRRSLAALDDWEPPVFPLKGSDIIALGVVPGPSVSGLVKRVEAQWLAEGFPSRDRVQTIATDAIEQRRTDSGT